MKIKWERDGQSMAGKIGDVICFWMNVSGNYVELTSDLPETLPGQHGRYVVQLPTVQKASTEAAKLLKNWEIRLTS